VVNLYISDISFDVPFFFLAIFCSDLLHCDLLLGSTMSAELYQQISLNRFCYYDQAYALESARGIWSGRVWLYEDTPGRGGLLHYTSFSKNRNYTHIAFLFVHLLPFVLLSDYYISPTADLIFARYTRRCGELNTRRSNLYYASPCPDYDLFSSQLTHSLLDASWKLRK
jgi:hypothetical protein